MDKLVGKAVKEVMGDSEKRAPVKSIKLKVKFRKPEEKKEEMAKKMGLRHKLGKEKEGGYMKYLGK